VHERKRENGLGIHFISDDFIDRYDDEETTAYALRHGNYVKNALVRRRLFKETINIWGQIHNLEGFILLEAHGSTNMEQWCFIDEKMETPVQRWVNGKDGQAASILIFSCNPNNFNLISQKSILVYLTQITNLPDALRFGYSRMFIPGVGYFDKNYKTLRRTIDKLSKCIT